MPTSFSSAEFDDFLHMWRVFGYYLGVEDKYNPVRETVEETISLLLDIGHQLLIPSILNLDRTGIHMGKVATKGFGADYHLLIYMASLSKLQYIPNSVLKDSSVVNFDLKNHILSLL